MADPVLQNKSAHPNSIRLGKYGPGKSPQLASRCASASARISCHAIKLSNVITHFFLFYFHRRSGKRRQLNPCTRFTLHDGLKGKAWRTPIHVHD
jgi:hypothetical protein